MNQNQYTDVYETNSAGREKHRRFIQSEKLGGQWVTLLPENEVRVGDLVADRQLIQAFVVVGFGATTQRAVVTINDDEMMGYSFYVDEKDVENFAHDEVKWISFCWVFLKQVCCCLY